MESWKHGRVTRVTERTNFKQKVKVTWTKMWKSFLRVSSWKVDLHQTKTKMIIDPSYTHHCIHFTNRNALFVRYLSVCLSVIYLTHTFRLVNLEMF